MITGITVLTAESVQAAASGVEICRLSVPDVASALSGTRLARGGGMPNPLTFGTTSRITAPAKIVIREPRPPNAPSMQSSQRACRASQLRPCRCQPLTRRDVDRDTDQWQPRRLFFVYSVDRQEKITTAHLHQHPVHTHKRASLCCPFFTL